MGTTALHALARALGSSFAIKSFLVLRACVFAIIGDAVIGFCSKAKSGRSRPLPDRGAGPRAEAGAQLCATPLCGTLPGAKLAARHPAQRSAAGRVTGHRPGTRSGCAACQCVTPTHVQRRCHRRALRPSLGSAPGVRTWVRTGGPPQPRPGSPRLWPRGIGPARPAAAPAESPADAEGAARTGTRQAPGSARPLSPAPRLPPDQTSRSACLALNLPSSPQICVSSVMSHRLVLEAGRAPTGPWVQAGRPPARSAHRSPPVGLRAAGGFPHRGLAPPTAELVGGTSRGGRPTLCAPLGKPCQWPGLCRQSRAGRKRLEMQKRPHRPTVPWAAGDCGRAEAP